MRKIIVLVMLLFPAMASASPADDLDAMEKHLPRDVRAVIDRRVACNHWEGEEPYDAARANQITRAVAESRCQTLDENEAALKRRYSGNAPVRKALALADDLYQ